MKLSTFIVSFIAAVLCILHISCGDDTDYPESIYSGCENIMKYCADQRPWSLYVTSASQCESLYECAYDEYSSGCRSRLAGILACAEDISDEDACEECGDKVAELQQNCPYPRTCFE